LAEGDNTSYVFAYKVPLAPGETTEPVFDAVQIVKYLEGEIKDTDKYQVVVEAYMIQSSFVEDADGNDITAGTVDESVLTTLYDTYVNQNGKTDYNLFTLGEDELPVDEAGNIQIPDAEAKTGYKFVCWIPADTALLEDEDIEGVSRKGSSYIIQTQTEADEAKEKYGIPSEYPKDEVPAGGLKIVPVYVPITYTVRLYKAAGNLNTFKGLDGWYYDVARALPTKPYSVTGYDFIGWSYTEGGNVNFKDGATVKNLTDKDGDIVNLYAVWKPNKVRIRYDANENEGIQGSFSNGAKINEVMVVSKMDSQSTQNVISAGTYMEPSHATMMFDGWYSDSDCTTAVPVDENGIPTTISGSEMTLYAKWRYPIVTYVARLSTEAKSANIFNAYVVSYKWEDGVNVAVDSGNTDRVQDEPPTNAAYRIGWSTSSDRTTEDFSLKDKLTGDVTVYECEVFSLSCTKALELNFEKAPHLKDSSYSSDKVKYAVSVYGILEDKDENGNMIPLTFGPATGDSNQSKSYINNYCSHAPSGKTEKGNMHRCIHDDSWDTIISWANKDPYVYEQCMYMGVLTRDEGNGDGVGTLMTSINSNYSNWNGYVGSSYDKFGYGDTTGGYPASRIRAVLNGSDRYTADGQNSLYYADLVAGSDMKNFIPEMSLLTTFPDEVKSAIVKKAVRSDTVNTDALNSTVTTYDKLWLFSSAELKEATDEFGSDGFTYDHKVRQNEGIGTTKSTATYSRQRKLGITQSISYPYKQFVYCETNAYNAWFLRTISYDDTEAGIAVDTNKSDLSSMELNYYDFGISPGFCIGTPVAASDSN
jgi:uncharacterized repeat protein (TIGR02543 family)